MHFLKQKAFTLVELIVVIVILAILATIAFLSFNSYNSSARDSVRATDMASIVQGLETFSIKAGNYPEPSGVLTDVTCSGTVVYSVGTIGDSMIRTVGSISKKPVDPLTQQEYSYSLGRNQKTKTFEISSNMEGTLGFSNDPFSEKLYNKTYASNPASNAYIKGNYNGFVLRAFTGGTYYGITSPAISLTSSGLTGTGVDILSLSGKLSYMNKSSAGIKFTPKVVYSGPTLELQTKTHLQSFIDGIQSSFTGSSISGEPAYSAMLNLTGTGETVFGAGIFTNHLGGRVLRNCNHGGNVVPEGQILITATYRYGSCREVQSVCTDSVFTPALGGYDSMETCDVYNNPDL